MNRVYPVILLAIFFSIPALAGEALSAGDKQTFNPPSQAVKSGPVPPTAPKAPNVRPGQPQQTPAQQNQQVNQQLKMWEERKQQEKAREKMLKDARTVQAAPSKGKPVAAPQGGSLNRTATDLGSTKR
jgi:hypothetical protein